MWYQDVIKMVKLDGATYKKELWKIKQSRKPINKIDCKFLMFYDRSRKKINKLCKLFYTLRRSKAFFKQKEIYCCIQSGGIITILKAIANDQKSDNIWRPLATTDVKNIYSHISGISQLKKVNYVDKCELLLGIRT